MNEEELNKIIADKQSVIDKFLTKMSNVSEKVQIAFLEYLFDTLRKQTTSGRLDDGVKNLNFLNSLETTLNKLLIESGFTEDASTIVRSFDETYRYNVLLQAGLNNIKVTGLPKSTVTDAFLSSYEQALLRDGMNMTVVVPIRDLLFKAILSGASLKTTEKALRTMVVGNEETLGKIQANAILLSRDALYGHDGTINNLIRNKYELNALRYVGSIKPGKTVKNKQGKTKTGVRYASRPQCIRWVEMGIIKMDELAKEISWAYRNGSGMKPDTTVSNFEMNRGGYNCRHQAIPIRVED